MVAMDFNANNVEPSTAPEPLPAGQYLVEITASEMKATKNGNGSYLQLEYTVRDGPYKGRKAWDRLCLNHPNELTQKIAQGNLSAICRTVGVMQPRDSVELHNIPLVITVKCKTRKDTGEIANEVKGYAKRGASAKPPQQAVAGQPQQASVVPPASQPQQPPATPPVTQPQQPLAGGSTPPWQR